MEATAAILIWLFQRNNNTHFIHNLLMIKQQSRNFLVLKCSENYFRIVVLNLVLSKIKR